MHMYVYFRCQSLIFLLSFIMWLFCVDRDGPTERWGVKQVLGQCSEGTILWRPPRGALRITLQLPTSPYVLACFSMATEHTRAKLSIEDKDNPHGIRDLAFTDHLPKQVTQEICVKGIHNVTLYIESHMDSKAETVGKVLLTYDLEAIDKKHFQDDLQGRQLYFKCVSSQMSPSLFQIHNITFFKLLKDWDIHNTIHSWLSQFLNSNKAYLLP